jgi:predicted ArsR family transcriptional regulator
VAWPATPIDYAAPVKQRAPRQFVPCALIWKYITRHQLDVTAPQAAIDLGVNYQYAKHHLNRFVRKNLVTAEFKKTMMSNGKNGAVLHYSLSEQAKREIS